MGFLQIKRDSIYLTIDANPKPIRPLLEESVGKWVHIVPECVQITPPPDSKKKQLRKFSMVDADFSRWFKDNPDPLWDMLDNKNKFDREGKRQDFAVRPQHLLPVWSYFDNDVKMVKQGNQFFEEMVKYYDGGGKVVDCDWLCWTEGSGMQKQYVTSRQDKSAFVPPVDPKLIGQKIQVLLKQALEDLRPFKTEEEMLKYLHGHAAEEAASFPYGANAPAQIPAQAGVPASMPAYVPGGAVPMQLGAPPIQQPTQQWTPPQPQQQWAPPQPAQQWTPPVQQPQAQQWTPPQPQQQWAPPQPAQQPAQQWTSPQQQWAPPQQVKVEVPNAPVTSQPVFAPPQQQAPVQVNNPPGTPPAQFAISFGKHAGKTLGWIKDNDPSYLSFLKGNKKELSSMIESLMGGAVAAPQVAVPQPPQSGPDTEAARSQLVKEINQKIMSVPEFQGPGIATAMMPFLQQTIGTTNFSDAPLDQLQTLKAAVDSKLSVRA